MTTRAEAKALGLNKYNTGKPCKNGHIADRYVNQGACTLCLNGIPKGKVVELTEEQELLKQINAIKRDCISEGIWMCTPSDFLLLRELAVTNILTKFPILPRESVESSLRPIKLLGHFNHYILKFLHEDSQMLRKMQLDLQILHPNKVLIDSIAAAINKDLGIIDKMTYSEIRKLNE